MAVEGDATMGAEGFEEAVVAVAEGAATLLVGVGVAGADFSA